ncbi:MAG: hypothetical protein E7182_05065 [Erysipelotrichaceae bacterium]|nr:hypothetical protein [Erysipelotrichaceae bacterium]
MNRERFMDRVTKVFQCMVKPGTEKSPSIAMAQTVRDAAIRSAIQALLSWVPDRFAEDWFI